MIDRPAAEAEATGVCEDPFASVGFGAFAESFGAIGFEVVAGDAATGVLVEATVEVVLATAGLDESLAGKAVAATELLTGGVESGGVAALVADVAVEDAGGVVAVGGAA